MAQLFPPCFGPFWNFFDLRSRDITAFLNYFEVHLKPSNAIKNHVTLMLLRKLSYQNKVYVS